MVCGSCSRAIGLVSGNHGGYYGCLSARVRGCDNRVGVRRILAETLIVAALQKRLKDPAALRYILQRVKQEVDKLNSDVPDTIRCTNAQLGAERRCLARLVDFIAEGHDSVGVRERLAQTEEKVSVLEAKVT